MEKLPGICEPPWDMVEIQLGPTPPTINGIMHFLTTFGDCSVNGIVGNYAMYLC